MDYFVFDRLHPIGESATRPIAQLTGRLTALLVVAGAATASSSRLVRRPASRTLGRVQLPFPGSIDARTRHSPPKRLLEGGGALRTQPNGVTASGHPCAVRRCLAASMDRRPGRGRRSPRLRSGVRREQTVRLQMVAGCAHLARRRYSSDEREEKLLLNDINGLRKNTRGLPNWHAPCI